MDTAQAQALVGTTVDLTYWHRVYGRRVRVQGQVTEHSPAGTESRHEVIVVDVGDHRVCLVPIDWI